ncbi:MAG: hypothetical protein BWX73_00903 [Lentisphaerae bacterium ADurb.Bin082]|nr:MAG: hypothetical protein BWX73_00903 [Lentisphaerae bacterium ADurb.Bin082]
MDEKHTNARVLAYYLPQFHPIPENDEWWGNGFTEWTNVGKAKPLFPGHYQPHVPADLGYYDLRVSETREYQAALARQYGVEGFVYWHYWFGNGKRLLERPFNEVLTSGKPDFPFALAWANESWRGTWHGLKNGRMLIEQTYPGDDDYIAHFKELLPAFKDDRYLRCNGKVLFFIYEPNLLPESGHFIKLWQGLAMENGLEGIFFVALEKDLYDKEYGEKRLNELMSQGYDAVNICNLSGHHKLSIWWRIARKIFYNKLHLIPNVRPYFPIEFESPLDSNANVIPAVVPCWDHTPRTGKNGLVYHGSTPELFKQGVLRKLDAIKEKPFEKRFLMIKSWNEWAEGNYMEPDLRWGRKYLEALKEVICS